MYGFDTLGGEVGQIHTKVTNKIRPHSNKLCTSMSQVSQVWK